ncbi:MAG TPA: hypothetical protein VM166_02915 [Gemmatimonadaceae bacterium]|nr:hypothetical protein [Gemmatimonadaceae bacterium]
MGKSVPARPSSTDVRTIMLRYFYERNKAATSARGKHGFAIKISDIRKELKASHGLTQQEVIGNLNYLISQGWIAEEQVAKSVPLPSGTIIPQATSYYKITAAGIDKIEGPGEFTMDKFDGIRIEATGQNIITLGDGNKVNVRFSDVAGALGELRQAIIQSTAITEAEKLDAVADIESVESQLVKSVPNTAVVSGAWEGLKKFETTLGIAEKAVKVGQLLASFLV